MDEDIVVFFDRAKAVSLTVREKQNIHRAIWEFTKSHPVRVYVPICRREWMENAQESFVGKATNISLTSEERASAFGAIHAFMDEHPVRTKVESSPWWERFLSSVYFYVPATAVILLLVVARGKYDEHPWKKSISPVGERETQEFLLPSEGAWDATSEEGEDTPLLIREPDWMGEGNFRQQVDRTEEGEAEREPVSSVSQGEPPQVQGADHVDDFLPRRRGRGGGGGKEDVKSLQQEDDDLSDFSGVTETREGGLETSEDASLDGSTELVPQEDSGEGGEPSGSVPQVQVPVGEYEDSEPPFVVVVSPPGGETNVPIAPNISVTFSETVVKGRGSIVIRQVRGNIFTIIDVSSGDVLVSGTAQVTIKPAAALREGMTYQVEIPTGAFQDEAGNPSGATTWSFTTEISLESYMNTSIQA